MPALTVGTFVGNYLNARLTWADHMTAIVFLKLSMRKLHLQEKALQTGLADGRARGNRWQPRWLDDPDRYDLFILSQNKSEISTLPDFLSGLFEPVRNRLRMSFCRHPGVGRGVWWRPVCGSTPERAIQLGKEEVKGISTLPSL